MQAIILAGGKGTRLKPFTTCIPKPLIPVGDLPILEIVLRQLKHRGFSTIIMAVNHLAELIMAFFAAGEKVGLAVTYSLEEQPLGTAGPLAQMKGLDENFLVMNGDLLTTLHYDAMMAFHLSEKNDITIACYKKSVKIDLGVIKRAGDVFTDYIEKPVYDFDVSMGVYVFNRAIVDLIQPGKKLDMPDLILLARTSGKKIKCYIEDCLWLDIGRVDDYEEAVRIFEEQRSEFLPS